jgi:purine-binding chemotaxis protein CheW
MEEQYTMQNWGNRSDQHNLVAFRLGEQTYALPIEPIVQIIEMVTITPIPQVNNAVEGVINMRGTAVPVVSMRRHFGMPEIPLQLRTPIIIVQIDRQVVGLIVDEVIDVLSLPPERISHTTDILPEGLGQASILRGLVHIQNDTVLLLDLEHLLLPYQAQALAQVTANLPLVSVEPSPQATKQSPTTGSAEPPSKILVEEEAKDTDAATVAAPSEELV